MCHTSAAGPEHKHLHSVDLCLEKWLQVVEYLGDMPAETPVAFGFHANAEIGFKLREGDAFCHALQSMQPRDAGGEGGLSEEEKARMVLEDIVERLPEAYDMEEIRGCAFGLSSLLFFLLLSFVTLRFQCVLALSGGQLKTCKCCVSAFVTVFTFLVASNAVQTCHCLGLCSANVLSQYL